MAYKANMIVLETQRSCYDPSQIYAGGTTTIDELIDYLNSLKEYENCSGETRIIFSNDHGYTYGEINLDEQLSIEQHEVEEKTIDYWADGYEEYEEDEDDDDDDEEEDEDE